MCVDAIYVYNISTISSCWLSCFRPLPSLLIPVPHEHDEHGWLIWQVWVIIMNNWCSWMIYKYIYYVILLTFLLPSSHPCSYQSCTSSSISPNVYSTVMFENSIIITPNYSLWSPCFLSAFYRSIVMNTTGLALVRGQHGRLEGRGWWRRSGQRTLHGTTRATTREGAGERGARWRHDTAPQGHSRATSRTVRCSQSGHGHNCPDWQQSDGWGVTGVTGRVHGGARETTTWQRTAHATIYHLMFPWRHVLSPHNLSKRIIAEIAPKRTGDRDARAANRALQGVKIGVTNSTRIYKHTNNKYILYSFIIIDLLLILLFAMQYLVCIVWRGTYCLLMVDIVVYHIDVEIAVDIEGQ